MNVMELKKRARKLVSISKQKGMIKPHTEAFKDFPVEEEKHKGKNHNMYIDYDFPNWNKYINAERTNKYIASKIKKEEKQIVAYLCSRMKPIEKYPVTIKIKKYVKTKNTDVDNIRIKGLLDGLVDIGVLKNDNLTCIDRIILEAEVSKTKDGIDIKIIEAEA